MGSFVAGISNLPPQAGTPTGDPYAPLSPGGDAAGTWYDPAILGASFVDSAPLAPSAVTTGPNPPGGFGSLEMGSFLDSIGNAIKKAIPQLSLPGFGWLWFVLIGLIVLLFAVLFTAEFGKGLGEGIATRA